MTLRDKIGKACHIVTDWFASPITILLVPIGCSLFLYFGGAEGRLTLILSILAISLTQMVLAAQNIDAEAMKLQIAELVKATPNARNKVIDKDLTKSEMIELEKEIENEVSEEV